MAAEVIIPPGTVNYRGFRFPWRTTRFVTDQQQLDISTPAVGTGWSQTVKVWNQWDRPITIDCLRTADGEFSAALASGSFKTDGMVIVPCSMKTLAGVAHGLSRTCEW